MWAVPRSEREQSITVKRRMNETRKADEDERTVGGEYVSSELQLGIYFINAPLILKIATISKLRMK